jgi:hypothetical protein
VLDVWNPMDLAAAAAPRKNRRMFVEIVASWVAESAGEWRVDESM